MSVTDVERGLIARYAARFLARGDMPIPVASASQRESIRMAGLRAREARDTLATRATYRGLP